MEVTYKGEIDLAIRIYWSLPVDERASFLNVLDHRVVERMTLWDKNIK